MEHAVHLLRTGTSVDQVAAQVGYSDGVIGPCCAASWTRVSSTRWMTKGVW